MTSKAQGIAPSKKAHGADHAETPISSGIHRAARRSGLEPAAVPAEEPDRASEELDALRHLAELAESIFESGNETGNAGQSVEGILREALRSARDDIELICDSNSGGSSVGFWPFRRAEFRIELALALAEYRAEWPRTESDDERHVREQFEAAEARAAGGAS